MTEQDWELVRRVHLDGAFKMTKAAWPIFQQQNYGRIIMTTSAAGLYGNYGQANYAAAKMALVGFGQTLAREGAKRNIKCNIVAPVAGSRITETVLPPDLIEKLKPTYVAPYVVYLCHEQCPENGSIYEVGAGYGAKVRWERSPGALLKVDHPSFAPSAVKAALARATSFHGSQHPNSMAGVDWVSLLRQAKSLPPNPQDGAGGDLRYDGRVVLVTGAGGGLGRTYALMFAKFGATVIVNDLGKDRMGGHLADAVVREIEGLGGKAVASYESVERGDRIIAGIIETFGKIDVVVNNAGILRDKSFAKMTAQEWSLVLATHLGGTFAIIKAAWPHMLRQKYGRIINTSSAVGLYGNFGQANYSAAKAGIIGFSTSLAAEGLKHNILVNVIAPNAGTQMTATILPQETVEILKPEYVAPLVCYLGHEESKCSGSIFEVGSGWFAKVCLQRAGGHRIVSPADQLSVETVATEWSKLADFSQGSTHPKSAPESFSAIIAMLSGNNGEGKDGTAKQGRGSSSGRTLHSYTKRDIMLYNLGVGCDERETKYVYEGDPDFAAVPTFAVIPAFVVMMGTEMDRLVEGFDPTKLLHGEHFVELCRPLPTEGRVTSERRVLQVLPKGKGGSIVVLQLKTFDEGGNLLAINEGTIFLRGTTPRVAVDEGSARQPLAVEAPAIPARKPDAIVTQKIPLNQAALYRLSGDYNPLHIDYSFAQMGGFPKPILHGLSTFGHAAHHVLREFADNDPRRFKAMRARFTKHVFPGETLQTEMWQVGERRVVFQVKVVERNEVVMANAFVELNPPPSQGGATDAPAQSPALKSEAIFRRFEKAYATLPAPMREEQVKKVHGVFQFEIKDRTGRDGSSYYIDLKEALGKIAPGRAPAADIIITVKDDDFAELAAGRLDGQQAFMKGLVRVKGNMMLAMKLDRILRTLSAATIGKSKI